MELATIYTDFHKVLLGFIKSKVNNHQDAEDILQNVFVKVATGVDDLNRKEKLQSWIYTIARNSIVDYYRSNTTQKVSLLKTTFLRAFQMTSTMIQPKGWIAV